ncbi:M28 family metallopeptidase [Croceiramulus getboli]|nr:M20/M25/M40 family metallo-hydrolase [Flavobacteriaceae bacterium YJPT1-3]
MRKLLLLSALLALMACKPAQPNAPIITSANAALNTTVSPAYQATNSSVQAIMSVLASDALEGRDTGSEGINRAAVFIENYFKEHNVQPYFEEYRDFFDVNGTKAYNVVGVVPGNDPQLKDQFIVIGAHYDHIGRITPKDGDAIANGANDNASGTTTVLELAQAFAKANNNKRSIIFALFSAEERGLKGSAHLAQRLKEQGLDLYTMFNVEMTGVPMTTEDYLVYLTGYDRSNLAEQFNTYTGTTTIGFLPQAKEFNLFMRSDNYPFYEVFKVPSHTVSTFDFTNYAYYHQVDDELELMNFDHMAKVVNALFPGLQQMANSAERPIEMTQE